MSDLAKFGFAIVAAGLLGFAGCYNEPPPAIPQSAPSEPAAQPVSDAAPQQDPSEPAPMPTEGNPEAEPGVEGDAAAAAPSAEDQSETAKIQAALASLSVEDRALAETQKICPVGGGPLGAMGAPIKVEVAGHTVFICCEGCEDPLVTDPAKHLAKIGLEPKEDASLDPAAEEAVQ